jgi:hypothetical protein
MKEQVLKNNEGTSVEKQWRNEHWKTMKEQVLKTNKGMSIEKL